MHRGSETHTISVQELTLNFAIVYMKFSILHTQKSMMIDSGDQ